jgi:hypothetical protein
VLLGALIGVVDEPLARATTGDRPKDDALGRRDALVEAVRRSSDARLVDLTDIYCPDGLCVAIIGNVVVYQDEHHVTATFARSLMPILAERIGGSLPSNLP